MSKQFIGYRISDESTNPRVTGAKFIEVRVSTYEKVNAAQELLAAAGYEDHSLENVQRRVQTMRKLRLSGWFEPSYSTRGITFKLQGSTEDGAWYHAGAELASFDLDDLKILTKIKAAAGDGGDRLARLIAALKAAGGVEISPVELKSARGFNDWIYVRKDELDKARALSSQGVESQEVSS